MDSRVPQWMPYPATLCWISLNAETGLYGYEVWYDGASPHDQADTFTRLKHVLWWVDPQNERIWVDVNDRASGTVMTSREYKPRSVPDRMCRR